MKEIIFFPIYVVLLTLLLYAIQMRTSKHLQSFQLEQRFLNTHTHKKNWCIFYSLMRRIVINLNVILLD